MREHIWLVAAAALAVSLSVGVATATAAKSGNSANAKLCYKGGWTHLVRSENSSGFASEEDCVSYAAQGGTLAPKPTVQQHCEALGGQYSTDPSSDQLVGGIGFLWSCNGWNGDPSTISADCASDGGSLGIGVPIGGGPAVSTCSKV